jgi:hypothetical protein
MYSKEGAKSVCIIATVAVVSKQSIVMQTLYSKFVYCMETHELYSIELGFPPG